MIRRIAFTVLIIALAILALVFGALNPVVVELELAFDRVTAPLGFLLVAAFVIGLLAGIFWRVSWVAALLTERGRLRRALRLAESRLRETGASDDES